MRKSLIILILATRGLFSCGQIGKTAPDKVKIEVETVESTKKDKRQQPLTYDLDKYIDTEFKYSDSTGNDVIIQNSFPKGGGEIDGIRGYTDSTGTHYGYGIFWTRVINETATSLELTISFPADSFVISSSQDSYFKLFIPPDTVTPEKLSLYNFGITGLRSFLDTNFSKPTLLQRTINPNEEHFFYIALLIHARENGPIRTGLVSKGQDLFYRISIDPFDTTLIPCGRIYFKK